MRVLIQRVLKASVKINNQIEGSIDEGLLVFVGFTNGDNESDIDYIINKIVNLRIFNDNNDIMNLSLLDISGNVLSISQFTLYADTKKGRRPSYAKSLEYKQAEELYDLFNVKLMQYNIKIAKGIFGSDMKVELINNGPVTILIDSREKGE
jgi:D-aminoacyl-tRNA deacylase